MYTLEQRTIMVKAQVLLELLKGPGENLFLTSVADPE